MKNKLYCIFLLIINFGFSQNIILKGTIIAQENIENIHVINSTQDFYTTTNSNGTFKIEAQINDTIKFKSLQYKLVTHIVNSNNIKNQTLTTSLETHVNTLPEANIGFTLTGDLTKDILNSDAKRPINFYDVGIPGYTGKKKLKARGC